MIKIGQTKIMQSDSHISRVYFRPPQDARLAVEVLSTDQLRQRAPPEHFEKLQRADFYRLIGVLEGQTNPVIDFMTYAASRGSWVLVRPGQVFRYDFLQPWQGWLLIFPPESLSVSGFAQQDSIDLVSRTEDLDCLQLLSADAHKWMCQSMLQIQNDCGLQAELYARNELLRLQLANILIRLSMWKKQKTVVNAPEQSRYVSFRRFRNLLENNFTNHHQVKYYASTLGMSEKTLGRTCLKVAGVSAKTLGRVNTN